MANKRGILLGVSVGLGALIFLLTRKAKEPEVGLRGIKVNACYDPNNDIVKIDGLWEQYGYSDASFTVEIIMYPEGGTKWGPSIQGTLLYGLSDGKQVLSEDIARHTVLAHGNIMGGLSGYYTVGIWIRAYRNSQMVATHIYKQPRKLFINLVAGTIEPVCGRY